MAAISFYLWQIPAPVERICKSGRTRRCFYEVMCAVNSGACNGETAGTATLIIFSGVSAEKIAVGGDSIAMKEIIMVHCFIVAPVAHSL